MRAVKDLSAREVKKKKTHLRVVNGRVAMENDPVIDDGVDDLPQSADVPGPKVWNYQKVHDSLLSH